MSPREEPVFDAKGVFVQIANLVGVPPENRDAFYRALYWIVRAIEERWPLGARDQRVSRSEVVRRLDALIVALETLRVDDTPSLAAVGFLFVGEPRCETDVGLNGLDDRAILGLDELLKRARRAKEIAMKTKLLRGRGTPQGTRGAPEFDYFLYEFFRATLKHGATRTTAFRDRVTGSAKGSIIDVLHLVAPRFDRKFLPHGQGRILYAIKCARRAAEREPIFDGMP
jgi:hypothetical protein